MTSFTIGCDPEIFLKKGKKAVSAHGVIEGTKKAPFVVDNGAYQVDGMAVEFNTDPVLIYNEYGAGNFKAFDTNITTVMKTLKEAVVKHDPDYRFNLSSVQEFSDDVFAAQPPEAVELGCDPDFNAYTGDVNPRPEGEAVNFRTASGHIHIGWGADIPVDHPDHMEICCEFIKYMDATVGLFMTIIDDDPRRRILYGKAGAFRPKPYGVEYRTPSNLWLASLSRRQTIFELTQAAVCFASTQRNVVKMLGMTAEDIQKVVDDGDYETANRCLGIILNEYYLTAPVQAALKAEYKNRLAREGKPNPSKISNEIMIENQKYIIKKSRSVFNV